MSYNGDCPRDWTVWVQVRDDGVKARSALDSMHADGYELRADLMLFAWVRCTATRKDIAERVVARQAKRLGLKVKEVKAT